MALSKEQVKWLEQAKSGTIPTGAKYFNSQKTLVDLVLTKKLIRLYQTWDEEADGLEISGYELTPEGKTQLDLYNESEKRNKLNHLTYPLVVSLASGILGAVIGALVTYLLMR